MSTATETCACGASITVDVRDGLTLGWRLSDWRREHLHDLDAADACRERDEARAEKAEAAIERVRSWCDDYDNHQTECAYWRPFPTGTVPVCDCSVRDLRAALDGGES